jgi:hypothetical protein
LATVGIHRDAAKDVRRLLSDGRGVLVVGGTDRTARAAACRALVDEVGTEERVIVVLYTDSELVIRGSIGIKLESTAEAGVHSSIMLGADAIVVDGVIGFDSSRAALDASSHVLVMLTVDDDDPVQIASKLVEDVGAFLVAGTIRAVLIASQEDSVVSTSVHVVTDDVCQAILNIDALR